MSYTKISWLNSPASTTPLGATNLNHVDQGVYDAHYPPLVSALPGSPLDGQVVWYAPAFFQGGSVYHPPILARYRATTLATYHWECASGEIAGIQNVTPSSAASATYVVATGGAGPTGIQIPNIGEWDIEITATLNGASGAAAQSLYLSFDVGVTGAIDADALIIPVVNATTQGTYTRRFRRNFPLAGVTLTPKVKNATNNTPTWSAWGMRAYPILIN